MKAILFAAGRGERMRPLTDTIPKPLLIARGKPLIVWHIEALQKAGVTELVINTAHLGTKLVESLGNGKQFGVQIEYSREELSSIGGALETAGGIAYALPLLGTDPFVAVSADVFCDFNYVSLVARAKTLTPFSALAHCVLVANPVHHPEGDFHLQTDGRMKDKTPAEISHTFSGIAAYHPKLFEEISRPSVAKLAPLLRQAMTEQRVTGEIFTGQWQDIGTPERLALLNIY